MWVLNTAPSILWEASSPCLLGSLPLSGEVGGAEGAAAAADAAVVWHEVSGEDAGQSEGGT